jgi:hypothetical protein
MKINPHEMEAKFLLVTLQVGRYQSFLRTMRLRYKHALPATAVHAPQLSHFFIVLLSQPLNLLA